MRLQLRKRWRAMSSRRRKVVVAIVVGVVLFPLVAALLIYASIRIPLPSEISTAQTTQVFYADGTTQLGGLQGEQDRTDVRLADLPDHVKYAVLAAEDRGYYHHPGVSITGIARAAWRDLFGSGATQGGSTITQQYARNAFLTRRRTFARKIRETVIAIKLDRKYSKDQILEWYLNTIYFGRGSYGIEAASLTYFGVPAKQLSVARAALLAALIRAPQSGDPAIHRDIAVRRWNGVLDAMVTQHWLDQATRDKQSFAAVHLRPRGAGHGGRGRLAGPTGYLLNEVRKALVAKGFGEAQIYTSGLRVVTTIDQKAQAAAEAAEAAVLKDPKQDPQSALVAIQPGSGAIRALYGGRDYVTKPLNFATEIARQPGSSFKPYVLAAAIDHGISLKSRFDGHSPQTFSGYPVRNFDDEQFGSVDLVDATAHSVNTVFVPLAISTGIDTVLDVAHRLGLPSPVACADHRDASLALGTCDLSPLDQADVYATFAARGQQAPPYLIEKVTDRRGKVLFQAHPKAKRAVAEGVSDDVTFALQAVVQRGTGRGAQLDGGRPAAGKTGTTTDSRDAWFCGFTPSLAAVVWMGYENPKGQPARFLRNVEGVPNVTGGTLPARIWKTFMDAAVAGTPVQDFPAPAFGGQDHGPASSGSPTASPTGPTPSLTVIPTLSGVPSIEPSLPLPTATTSTSPSAPPSSPSPSPSPTSTPTPLPSATPSPPAPEPSVPARAGRRRPAQPR